MIFIPDMELPHYRAFEKRDMSVQDIPWGTFERLGLMHREYEANAKLARDGDGREIIQTEMDYWFAFTEYGVRFLAACQGPSPASSASDASMPKPSP
jgi:hypothetical protein